MNQDQTIYLTMATTSTPPPHSTPIANQDATAQTPLSSPSPAAQSNPEPTTVHISNKAALAAAWRTPRPLLTHLNADTTWVLHIPYPEGVIPPRGRSRFNVLLDPWLRGPQSDGGRWFSIQWHVVASSVQTMGELDALLAELEAGVARDATAAPVPAPASVGDVNEDVNADADADANANAKVSAGDETKTKTPITHIDAVSISHEFTDHCHEATLRELCPGIPILAPSKAAGLIRSWNHFTTVVETPAFSSAAARERWRAGLLGKTTALPPWLGIGRVVTPGNALYYHSAVIVAWEASGRGGSGSSGNGSGGGEAIIYSPHGIEARALEGLGHHQQGQDKDRKKEEEEEEENQSNALQVLALLHGLDDVRLHLRLLLLTKQLNLGAVNGVAAARASRARYWVATHDEVKRGGGVVSLLLTRTRWAVADAVAMMMSSSSSSSSSSGKREEDGKRGQGKTGGEGEREEKGEEKGEGFKFVEMGSGDALVLV